MQYIKKDQDSQVASSLRSLGMQIDAIATELILSVSDRVRKNRDAGKETTLTEIQELKKEVESAFQMSPPKGMPPPLNKVN